MSDHGQVGLSAVALALAGVALLWVPVLSLHLTPHCSPPWSPTAARARSRRR